MKGKTCALTAQVTDAVNAQAALECCTYDIKRSVKLQHLCRRHVKDSVQQELAHTPCTLMHCNVRAYAIVADKNATHPLVWEKKARYREHS